MHRSTPHTCTTVGRQASSFDSNLTRFRRRGSKSHGIHTVHADPPLHLIRLCISIKHVTRKAEAAAAKSRSTYHASKIPKQMTPKTIHTHKKKPPSAGQTSIVPPPPTPPFSTATATKVISSSPPLRRACSHSQLTSSGPPDRDQADDNCGVIDSSVQEHKQRVGSCPARAVRLPACLPAL